MSSPLRLLPVARNEITNFIISEEETAPRVIGCAQVVTLTGPQAGIPDLGFQQQVHVCMAMESPSPFNHHEERHAVGLGFTKSWLPTGDGYQLQPEPFVFLSFCTDNPSDLHSIDQKLDHIEEGQALPSVAYASDDMLCSNGLFTRTTRDLGVISADTTYTLDWILSPLFEKTDGMKPTLGQTARKLHDVLKACSDELLIAEPVAYALSFFTNCITRPDSIRTEQPCTGFNPGWGFVRRTVPCEKHSQSLFKPLFVGLGFGPRA